MTVLCLVAGLAVVAVTLVDVGWTTIAAGSGAGPLAARLARSLWRAALALHRRRSSHAALSAAGPLITFAVLTMWIALLLAGWSLVFAAADGAVLDATTRVPADLAARVYFVGFSVFTLGNGDYVPGGGTWQLTTIAATGTGLVLVTLSITYLVPVASAVATRRQLAASIAALGATPTEILTTTWDGTGFEGLADQLRTLTTLLETARQQHYTYPVLHYFHSSDVANAAAPNVANLAQALHLLRYGVDPSVRPAPASLFPLERTIDAFLATLRAVHLDLAAPLPLPSLEPLTAAGIPTAQSSYVEADDATRKRRRLLAGLLLDDGWPNNGGAT